jgi:mono/diheme cytochrome c family protein
MQAMTPAPAGTAAAPAAAAPAAEKSDTSGPIMPPDPDAVERGHTNYQRYCQACHGAYGDSHGDSADYLEVKPRDFTKGIYKFRITPAGTLPLDSDIFHTLRNGLWGSGMPKWAGLGDGQVWDLVAYVESFSPRFYQEPRGTPITIPDEPEMTQASVDNGKKVYDSMGCYNCHGAEGRGNGPSVPTLVDDWGNSIKPLNFTTGHWKSGTELKDIYKDFMTGVYGTPMPSFADSMTPAQAWDLVHYLKTLMVGEGWNKGSSPGRDGTAASMKPQATNEVKASAPQASR